MGATFPNGIASFSTKRNLLDDVDANDINKMQDEIVAIESALGAALNEINLIQSEVTVLTEEEQTLAQGEEMLQLEYKSLKDLISALWNGKNIYAASAKAVNKKLPATPKDRPYPPALVQMSKPSQDEDPFGMWNGTGFTLKASGFWLATAQFDIGLAKTGPGSNDNFGTYEGSITINANDWTTAVDRDYPQVDKSWHNVMLNPTLLRWLPKGTRLTPRAAQSSHLTQSMSSASLSVFRVRASDLTSVTFGKL